MLSPCFAFKSKTDVELPKTGFFIVILQGITTQFVSHCKRIKEFIAKLSHI